MGHKTKTASFEVVDLEQGYHATIQKLRKVDIDACVALLNADGSTNAAYGTEMIVRSIANWDVDDDEGNIVPITHASVGAELTTEESTALLKAISALSTGIDPQSASAGSNGASS